MKMLMFDFRDSEKEYFKKNSIHDLEIEFIEESLNENTILTDEQKENTVIVSVFINSNLSEKILSQFKNLQIVTTRSTGYNHIDIEHCRKNNIAVINIPDYGKTSVAQYTIGMIITLVRNVFLASNDIKNKEIEYRNYEGRDLSTLSLGVIGTGSIGSAVCELANMFNMKIYAHDIRINDDINDFVEYVCLDELIAKSDIITLHIPYIKEFYHMLSEKEFKNMKDGVYIINTSRGELIDIEALYENVKNGKIKGVALDVIECEYLNYEKKQFKKALDSSSEKCLKNTLIIDKLINFDNVIITPHIAYNTQESIMNILDNMFKSIKRHYNGDFTSRAV